MGIENATSGLAGLRKLARDVRDKVSIWQVVGYEAEEDWCPDERGGCNLRDTLGRLADEIESERPALTDAECRVLDMWPRFEDGEPVIPGDEFINRCQRRKTVKSVDVRDGSTMLHTEDRNWIWYYGSERVKRAPEVLDADGVPLEVGDTVWNIKNGAELVITSTELDKFDHVKASQENPVKASVLIHPTRLTHQRPVLDADGVPIKVGDTVWIIPECSDTPDEPHEVRGIDRWGEVLLEFHFEHSTGLKGEYLIHTRPDSWERLEEDAREFARDNQLPHDADQMERDALDLVRRAKRLAGVES